MPTYRIERYEIHTQAYLVEAASEAEAVKKALDGLAEVAPDEFSARHSYWDRLGLQTSFTPRLTAELGKLGLAFPSGIIPSIASVSKE